MLIPSQSVPSLSLELVSGDRWSLESSEAERFTMLFFYRGLHCPICRGQLKQIERELDRFTDLGTHPVAISMDTLERAGQSAADWGIKSLPFARAGLRRPRWPQIYH